jgi:hypothetical protein
MATLHPFVSPYFRFRLPIQHGNTLWPLTVLGFPPFPQLLLALCYSKHLTSSRPPSSSLVPPSSAAFRGIRYLGIMISLIVPILTMATCRKFIANSLSNRNAYSIVANHQSNENKARNRGDIIRQIYNKVEGQLSKLLRPRNYPLLDSDFVTGYNSI